jgi:hypothetical protein
VGGHFGADGADQPGLGVNEPGLQEVPLFVVAGPPAAGLQGFAPGGLGHLPAHPALGHHLVQKAAHALPDPLEVAVAGVGSGDQGGQVEPLGQAQAPRVLAEVGLRRPGDPHRVPSPGNHVQVHLQDLLLGVAPLQLQGQNPLLDLPFQGSLLGQVLEERVLEDLGGDGAPPLEVPLQHGVKGSEEAEEVHPVVLEVAAVLGEDDGGHRRRGDLGKPHQAPVDGPPLLHAGDLGEERAVPGVEGGGGGQAKAVQLGKVGEVPGEGVGHVAEGQPRPQKKRQEEKGEKPKPAHGP